MTHRPEAPVKRARLLPGSWLGCARKQSIHKEGKSVLRKRTGLEEEFETSRAQKMPRSVDANAAFRPWRVVGRSRCRCRCIRRPDLDYLFWLGVIGCPHVCYILSSFEAGYTFKTPNHI